MTDTWHPYALTDRQTDVRTGDLKNPQLNTHPATAGKETRGDGETGRQPDNRQPHPY